MPEMSSSFMVNFPTEADFSLFSFLHNYEESTAYSVLAVLRLGLAESTLTMRIICKSVAIGHLLTSSNESRAILS